MITRHQSRWGRKPFLSCAAMAFAIAITGVPATAYAEESVRVDMEAQPLGEALGDIGNSFGVTVIAPDALVRGKRAPRISGSLTAEQAVARVLRGSGLTYRRTRNGGFVVEQQTARAQPIRPPRQPRVEAPVEPDEPMVEEMIIVTGTNIRGIAPESSPARTFDRQDVIATGAPTAQDFVLTIPQNFGGGATALAAPAGIPGDQSSVFNSILGGGVGSSVNLRGLGSGATLVLLNGRRLPLTSAIGNFVDISLIPGTAIERVDLVLDGASSIYGADAVAGVTNFILRRDFDGVEGTFRLGVPTQGGFEEYRAGLTAGRDWNTGGIIASYEYFDQGNLATTSRDFASEVPAPTDILPEQERHSVLVTAHQDINPSVRLEADVFYAIRDTTAFVVTPETDRIGTPETQTFSVAGAVEWDFAGDWTLDLGGTYGFTSINQTIEFLSIDPVKQTTTSEMFGNDIDSSLGTIELGISGTVLELPGGDLKLATGGQIRLEDFENIDAFDGTIGREADREVYAAFAEVLIPVFGEGNALPGLERLEVNASVRIEDYSDFGSTTNPKVGVLWQPVEQLRFKGSYSTSFTAPALGLVGARDSSAVAAPVALIDSFFGFETLPELADSIALYVTGTSQGLEAETSTSWSFGADFVQEWERTRLTASVNYFDIDFENRIGGTPIPGSDEFGAINFAFENPGVLPLGTVIFDATPDVVRSLVENQDIDGGSFAGVDPLDADIINFAAVQRNLASTRVQGLDFSLGAQFELSDGVINASVDGTYFASFENAATAGSPVVDVVSTQFNPVDLVLRGNLGYSTGGLNANVFVNYTNDYRVTPDPTSDPIGDFLTFDLSLVYEFGTTNRISALDDLSLRLFLLNVFDEAPPSAPGAPAFGIAPYDPANASAIGRFFAFEIAKRF